jgi:hypothetical protein
MDKNNNIIILILNKYKTSFDLRLFINISLTFLLFSVINQIIYYVSFGDVFTQSLITTKIEIFLFFNFVISIAYILKLQYKTHAGFICLFYICVGLFFIALLYVLSMDLNYIYFSGINYA